MAAQLPHHLKPKALALGVFIALHPLSMVYASAGSQFQCSIGADGQWVCTQQDQPRPLTRQQAKTAPQTTKKASSSPATSKEISTEQAAQTKGYALSSRSLNYQHLDWVPRNQLTQEQRAEIAPYCGGGYIEPLRLGKDDNTPLKQAPIYVNAINSSHDQNTQRTVLTDDVVIRQGSLHAESDYAQLDQLNSVGTLTGHVSLRDNDILFVGDKAQLQLDTGEAQIDNAEYVVHSKKTRGSAEYIKRTAEGIIRLKSGSYTSCAPNKNDWHLKSNNVTLNQQTGFGTATNATLRVKNVPVLYTPYIQFPIDDRRFSGFLAPSLSYSRRKGTDVTTPYYINLAPNYDATIYPNYISKRGLLTEAEFRYLTKQSEGFVGAAWLGNDKETERKQQSEYKSDRWLVHLHHQHGFNSRLLAELDYTDISDPYYFQDLNSNIVETSDTTVNQRGSLTWRGDHYSANLNAHRYERANITDITPYDKLPQLSINGRVPGELAGLELSYQTEWVRFERTLKKGKYRDRDDNLHDWRDVNLNGLNRTDGNRAHIEPNLSLPLDWSWGFLKPSVKLAYTKYDLSLDQKGKKQLGNSFNKSPSRSVPLVSLDSGLYFERPTTLFGKNYTQTLEPRLLYLYVPYKDQTDIPLFDTSESAFSYATLFRDNRFSGRDRIGDTQQVSLGLTYRWLEETGFERQRVSIGQAYYFRDRKVMLDARNEDAYKSHARNTRKRSPYAGQYAYNFNQDWKVNADYAWDPYTRKPRTGSVSFSYQPEDNLNKIINFGYRYSNDGIRYDEDKGRWITGSTDYYNPTTKKTYKDFYKIEQTDTSIMWPIFTRWNAIARWQFDYNRNRTLEALGGFEYNNCCWKVRLISRYWVDYDERTMSPEDNRTPDRGVFLQIVLKGLGGITGNKVSTFLDEGIPGYQRREDNAY